MNHKQTLIAAAAAKRDATIREANLQYRRDAREIRAAARQNRSHFPARPAIDDSLRDCTAIAAAETVLWEHGEPLTLAELVIEIQDRGCRSGDDPKAVLAAIGSSFRYHRDRFWQDAEGRWALG